MVLPGCDERCTADQARTYARRASPRSDAYDDVAHTVTASFGASTWRPDSNSTAEISSTSADDACNGQETGTQLRGGVDPSHFGECRLARSQPAIPSAARCGKRRASVARAHPGDRAVPQQHGKITAYINGSRMSDFTSH